MAKKNRTTDASAEPKTRKPRAPKSTAASDHVDKINANKPAKRRKLSETVPTEPVTPVATEPVNVTEPAQSVASEGVWERTPEQDVPGEVTFSEAVTGAMPSLSGSPMIDVDFSGAEQRIVDLAAGTPEPVVLTKRITEKGGLTSYARPGIRASVYANRNLFTDGRVPDSITIICANLALPGDSKSEQDKAERARKIAEKAEAAAAKATQRAEKAKAKAAKVSGTAPTE